MGSDTDYLLQLDDESDELADTIVLEDSDIMATREFRALVDPGLEPTAGDDDPQDDGPQSDE